VVAATCVVLVAAVVIVSKKRQAATARSRVLPFNAETDATNANAKPTAIVAAPPTHDVSMGNGGLAKVLGV
jgi:hypothetical protein